MTVDEVKATLRQGIDSAGAATRSLASARDRLHQARTLSQTSTHDSQDDRVTVGLRRITETDHEIDVVLRRLSGSVEAAEEYLDHLG